METDDLDKNKTTKKIKMSREILIKIHRKSSLQILGENLHMILVAHCEMKCKWYRCVHIFSSI